ncbi:hypothetical protein EDC04DRAFT_372379 [Pisolithus marmoratus]|nr:hypothetical protein EDC04DRAFT_372379 [Pisolithus marmoratus]
MSNMVNRLPYGRYYITSLEDNRNLGVSRFVNPIYPPPPVPVIVLPQGVLPSRVFTVVPVEGGDNTYVILVERRLVRGDEDRVLAYENEPAEVWVIRFREHQNAYTIERRYEVERQGEPLAWTAPRSDQEHERQVLLCPLLATKSEPPQFRPTQLFRFERVPLE